jgi:hypothetical protein
MPTGALIGGLGLSGAGAITNIFGSQAAAGAQTAAANQANQTIQNQYNTNAANLAPWMQSGANANNITQFLTGTGGTSAGGAGAGLTSSSPYGGFGSLTAAFNPTQAQLAQTPGYQFTLGQGLKSVQNSYASKGLGSSGAAMKGAADYATGDASQTYQQQFQNYWSQNQSIYNMLTGQSGQGLQAAGALAGAGTTAAGQQSANTVGAGQAQAAAYNSIGPAVSSVGNTAMTYGLLSSYLNNNGGTNGTGSGNIFSNPSYGGGNMFTDTYGGNAQNPLPGLTASDYG